MAQDTRKFYYVLDGKLVDADVGIDTFEANNSATVKFKGGAYETSNMNEIDQLQEYADTAGHPVTTSPPKKEPS